MKPDHEHVWVPAGFEAPEPRVCARCNSEPAQERWPHIRASEE